MGMENFGDFLQGTGELSVRGPQGLVNDATKNTYYTGRYIAGKGDRQLRQGGSRLRVETMLDEQNTAEFYSPAQPRSYANPQVLSKIVVDWRYLRDDMTYEEQELLLNDGQDEFQQFQDMRDKLEARVITSIMNKKEENFWEVPIESEMEAQSGVKPYSVWSFVNTGSLLTTNGGTNEVFSSDDTPGLTGAGTYNNGLFDNGATSWSTKAGIDPTSADVQNEWQAKCRTYKHVQVNPTNSDFDTSTPGTTGNPNDEYGLYHALDNMYLEVHFQPIPSYQHYFNDPVLYGQHVCASKKGVNLYKRLMRASNDTLAMGKQDSGYNSPTIYGAELVYCSEMNDAPVFLATDGTTLVTETGDGAINTGSTNNATTAEQNGPAFLFLNSGFYHPVYHAQRFMKRKPPMNDRERPETWSVPIFCYYNHVPSSLRRLGIVKGDRAN